MNGNFQMKFPNTLRTGDVVVDEDHRPLYEIVGIRWPSGATIFPEYPVSIDFVALVRWPDGSFSEKAWPYTSEACVKVRQ